MFNFYKYDVKTGDKDYIIRGLMKQFDKLETDKIQLIKVFFPGPALTFFGKKYVREAHCVVDELSELIHGKDIYQQGRIIHKEGKVPVLIFRKFTSSLYAWNRGYDLFERKEEKAIDEWVEEQIRGFSQKTIDEHLEQINEDVAAYRPKVNGRLRKDWAMERYVKYLTFTILVLTKSKLVDEHGSKGQIEAMRRAVYNIFNKCGDLQVPDSSLPEDDYMKMVKIHEESRTKFLQYVIKCFGKLKHYAYACLFTEFVVDLWFYRHYRVEGLNDSHFVQNVTGDANQTIRAYLRQILENTEDYKKDFVKEPKKTKPKKKFEEIAKSVKVLFEKDEEVIYDMMNDVVDVSTEKIMKASEPYDMIDAKMKSFLLDDGKPMDDDDYREDFNEKMKELLGIEEMESRFEERMKSFPPPKPEEQTDEVKVETPQVETTNLEGKI